MIFNPFLPFLDEPRLHAALRTVYQDLTEDEIRRNGVGRDLLFVSRRNPVYGKLRDLYEKNQEKLQLTDGETADVNCKDIHGIQGTLCPDSQCDPDDTFLQDRVCKFLKIFSKNGKYLLL